ncbi:MAG: methylated-DNA--[protein]-cysteine S-methyltransferase [Burkholderiales bacterium]|nr:methylated-DNA--[protein]-cysteine S-methyltransferase [Burkholderiales bacterium]
MPLAPLPTGVVARATLDTPVGPVHAAATERGVALLEFAPPAGYDACPPDPQQRWLAQLARELAAYARDPHARFAVPLDLQGTPFQREVWRALLEIPAGHTVSYAEVASRCGRPKAVRAVGSAVGSNPVAIVVPCHRVIGRDGTLTGYAGGLARKTTLLRHEGAMPEAGTRRRG